MLKCLNGEMERCGKSVRYNLEKLIETGNKRIKNVYNIYMYIYGVCSWNNIKIKVFDITRR